MGDAGDDCRGKGYPGLARQPLPPSPVAMENESAVYTRNTLTSRNHMQKAAMFALIPKTHLGSTDQVHVECCGDLRSATAWIEGPPPHGMPEGVYGAHLVGPHVANQSGIYLLFSF